MKLKALSEALETFRKERDWDQFHSPKNLSMALMVEAGELAEQFQWLTEEESRNLPPGKEQAVREEMADVFLYLLHLCDKLDVDLVEAAWEKLERVQEKYPAARVRGKHLKYDEYPRETSGS